MRVSFMSFLSVISCRSIISGGERLDIMIVEGIYLYCALLVWILTYLENDLENFLH